MTEKGCYRALYGQRLYFSVEYYYPHTPAQHYATIIKAEAMKYTSKIFKMVGVQL